MRVLFAARAKVFIANGPGRITCYWVRRILRFRLPFVNPSYWFRWP